MFTVTNIQKSRTVWQRLATCCVMLVCLFVTTHAFAKDFSFTWSANPEPVEGYKLYYKKGGTAGPPFDGTESVKGPSPINVGKQTAFTLTGLADNTNYYFALTAYNGIEESGFSQIISVVAPAIEPAAAYSIWPDAVTPGFSYDNPQPIELGLKFRSDVDGYVSGVRFFKAAGATGTHIGRLWTASGSKLAEVTFANETASGWQTATFATPVAIQANTTYIISYYVADGNRRFSDTFDYFAASGVDNSPLHALEAGVDGPNGVYSETGGFFNQTIRSSNYWVDLVFTSGPDTTPPTVPVITNAPVAIIVTPSLAGNAPFNLNFDGTSSTGTISTYSWTFGDGATANGSTTSHIYQSPGTYTATLFVESTSGLSNQTSVSITVTASAVPPPVFTNPTTVISSSNAVGNAPLTVQFDGSASTTAQPPIVSYSWDFGDGAIAGGATVAHSYTVPGTYYAVLKITDNAGLTGQTSTPVIIGAAPLPVVKPPVSSFIATPNTGTSPLKVTFNASGSSAPAGSISEYLWNFGDGSSATGISPRHTFTAKANYIVTLKVTDNLGGTATSSGTVSVTKLVRKDSTAEKDNIITPIIFLLLNGTLKD